MGKRKKAKGRSVARVMADGTIYLTAMQKAELKAIDNRRGTEATDVDGRSMRAFRRLKLVKGAKVVKRTDAGTKALKA